MRTNLADTYWVDSNEADQLDRAPGQPLLGFVSATIASLGLWIVIGLALLRLFL